AAILPLFRRLLLLAADLPLIASRHEPVRPHPPFPVRWSQLQNVRGYRVGASRWTHCKPQSLPTAKGNARFVRSLQTLYYSASQGIALGQIRNRFGSAKTA